MNRLNIGDIVLVRPQCLAMQSDEGKLFQVEGTIKFIGRSFAMVEFPGRYGLTKEFFSYHDIEAVTVH